MRPNLQEVFHFTLRMISPQPEVRSLPFRTVEGTVLRFTPKMISLQLRSLLYVIVRATVLRFVLDLGLSALRLVLNMNTLRLALETPTLHLNIERLLPLTSRGIVAHLPPRLAMKPLGAIHPRLAPFSTVTPATSLMESTAAADLPHRKL